ncbi:MAG: hypothetical protein L0H55_12240 [Candidatus Nitrosocosmicus sp.]|nr:hypothetical protein [Candidatus Nitrosocosmicus sp.]
MNQNLNLLATLIIIMGLSGSSLIFILSLLLLPTHIIPVSGERYPVVFAQMDNDNNTTASNTIANNKTWISQRDNLNIAIELEPKIPIIDEWTKLQFEVRNLDTGNLVTDNNSSLTINVTMTDHDSRLFKFPEQTITDGKFNVDYIFPDDGQHQIILQLYKNSTAFTIASLDLNIPHPQSSKGFLAQLFQAQPF